MSKCFYCRIDGQLRVGAFPSPRGVLLATGPEHALRKMMREAGQQSWSGWFSPTVAQAHQNAKNANAAVATFLDDLRSKYSGASISFPDRTPTWGKDGRRV